MVLVNEFLQVQIDPKGAELKSLRSNEYNHEYLWQANPQYWAKTSPILFPIVGELKGGTYFYEHNSYRLPRHGFARDHVFTENKLSDTEAVFTLKDSVETHRVYPFAFRLSVHYKLVGRALSCSYEVYNPSASKPLLFSIGGHPAFATATGSAGLDYEDYFLEFPDDDVLVCHKLEGNLISDHINAINLGNHRLPLTHELFYGDALVLKTMKSREITLRNRVNERGIHFRHENFPFFGIWAAKGADFVCLEPWCGIADQVGHNQQLNEKEGVQRLEAGGEWMRTWEVQLY